MYSTIKKLMPDAQHIYGPMTQEQAFDLPVASYATTHDSLWYAGTQVPVEALVHLEQPAPVTEPPVEPTPVTEPPVEPTLEV